MATNRSLADNRPDNPSGRPVVLSRLEDKVRPAWTALLVIDMVNDFLDPKGKTAALAGRPIDFARSVIPAQQRLLAAARRAGVQIVHVTHTTRRDYACASGPWLDARSRATYSVEDICLEDTWGAEVIEELAPLGGEPVVHKYRYSGFAGTNLDAVLRGHEVKTVICMGVSTNACVEATAREAFSLDYYVVLPADCCASWSIPLHEATLETAGHRYAVVCSQEELAATWGQREPLAAAPGQREPLAD